MPQTNTGYISFYNTDTTDNAWCLSCDDTGTASNQVESDVNPWVMPVAPPAAAQVTVRISSRIQAPEWGRVRYSIRDWYEDVPESLEEIEHKADWEV